MSEPSPEPVPEPAPPVAPHVAVPEVAGLGARFEHWLAGHLGPDLKGLKEDLAHERISAANRLLAIQHAAPVLERYASLLEAAVKAGTLPADLAADAEKFAPEAGAVAAELAALL